MFVFCGNGNPKSMNASGAHGPALLYPFSE